MKDYHIDLLLRALSTTFSEKELRAPDYVLEAFINLGVQPKEAIALLEGALKLKRVQDKRATSVSYIQFLQ